MSFSYDSQYKNQDLLQSLLQKSQQLDERKRKQQKIQKQPKSSQKSCLQRQASPSKRREYDSCNESSISKASQNNKPKIDKNSQLLVEESFKKLTSPSSPNAKIRAFFQMKSQLTQTDKTCQEMLKKEQWQQSLKEAMVKKQPKKNLYDPKKSNKKPNQRSQTAHTETDEAKPEKVSIQVQTEFEENKTPERKPFKQGSTSTGEKQSYYIPIHERSSYVLQTKQEKLQKLQQKQEESLGLKKSEVYKRPLTIDDDDQEEDRLQVFVESQNSWLQRKKNRQMTEQIKQAEMERTKNDELEYTTRSQISNKSKALANRATYGMDFMSRQTFYQEQKELKLQKLGEHPRNCTFAPRLSPQSRYIILQQMEREQDNY